MARRPRTPEADSGADAFACFHPITAEWFQRAYGEPTAPQRMGWPVIARGESALILAPTGSGKTLTAFLWCLDRLMLHPRPENPAPGARILYISPLKALAVDVERNLRAPLAGIAGAARRAGVPFHSPSIAVRTGDTPQRERAAFRRHPAEILITTPESLYLMLTSQTAEALRTIDTVIVDEIHALVPTKRGVHLSLSLERLEAIVQKPLQRIGLSATQRPLEEVARFLGGVETASAISTESASTETAWSADAPDPATIRYRPVTIVNASAPKRLKLRIEVPVEDMARLAETERIPTGDESQPPRRVSLWNAIHPRLLELIRPRKSTILFVNSRQVAERLAGALNDLAGEPLVRAHHGSLAADQRAVIEDQLKAGQIKALCATSTLELGIDMGAVDLVIQIEAPPSVASGMQRIGRAGHQVDAVSEGILFPKFRADLVACAAVTRAMHEGHIESTRYPRNPLDVLAQQIVATVCYPPALVHPRGRGQKPLEPEIKVNALYDLVRRAAPFAGLTRTSFEGVLDLLSGRYPSDEFADLRPRITWDRARNVLTAREGAARIAILNAGTIPDRGLYGVFLAHAKGKPIRVGELDEEMVFETHTNETFILGASTWRIVEVTHDRVLVEPAPGEPGKMPFWKGDGAGRPLEFGHRIGTLVRELREMPHPAALTRLVTEHDLDPIAAENLLAFLADQHAAAGAVPDDRTIVIERTRDELGDWRVCVLTPFGRRIHIPWAMAVAARIRAAGRTDVETLWGDDGFVLRFPDTDEPPDADWFLVPSSEAMQLVLNQLGSTALFAGRFREAAGRALLLPRKRIDRRSPLWQLRKRSYDLLSVASRYPSFPLLLEAYRECLRDVFDMPALLETLRSIEYPQTDQRQIRIHVVNTLKPSPFASSLLFSYVASFLYDLDAPLAERRAQALTIDQDQLRELLGEADLRELLDADVIREVEAAAQCLTETTRARSADGIHDLLLKLGDLSRDEIAQRIAAPELLAHVDKLLRARRAIELPVAGQPRLIAVEDAARYRDALGMRLPKGIPAALLSPVAQPLLELIRRYARTHGPFTAREAAMRFGLDAAQVEPVLHQLVAEGRILEGAFRPGGIHREWCDAEILRQIRQKSLARLRKEVEPVSQPTLARFLTHWQGLLLTSRSQPRRNLDTLLDAIENLQGAPLAASLLESSILPARVADYDPAYLDTLIAAGEVVWMGVEPLGARDGRVALYLADKLPLLAQPRPQSEPLTEREESLLAALNATGASFFDPLHQATGSGYPGDSVDALWSLVWRGLVTNDSLHALRAYSAPPENLRPHRAVHTGVVFRSRRTTPPEAQGRWSLVPRTGSQYSTTERSHALALQLLHRYGVLLREHTAAESIPGGFSAVYDVLKALEDSGRVRRGYFVASLGATQFALPAALDLLRRLRNAPNEDKAEFVQLSAADPANPYGSVLPWPELPVAPQDAESAPRILTRASYAEVILRNGQLIAWLRRDNPNLLVFLPPASLFEDEPERSHAMAGLAHFLCARGQHRLQAGERRGMLIATVNGLPVASHPLARFLMDAGFHPGPLGMNLRRIPASLVEQEMRPEELQ
jgi:ATP-dependent helicase Lhr and Lhr-like helicase